MHRGIGHCRASVLFVCGDVMTLPIKILRGISELTAPQTRHPGGHNWPDLEVVIDPSQTEIEHDELYLIQINDREPIVKRCQDRGSSIMLHPAVATIHSHDTAMLFGRKIPVTGIEFSDAIYKWHITVKGKVIGLYAGAT